MEVKLTQVPYRPQNQQIISPEANERWDRIASATPGFCVHDFAQRRVRAAINIAGSKPCGVKFATPAEFEALTLAVSELSEEDQKKVRLVDWTQKDKQHRKETGGRRR